MLAIVFPVTFAVVNVCPVGEELSNDNVYISAFSLFICPKVVALLPISATKQ